MPKRERATQRASDDLDKERDEFVRHYLEEASRSFGMVRMSHETRPREDPQVERALHAVGVGLRILYRKHGGKIH